MVQQAPALQLPDKTDTDAKQLSPNVSFRWLHDGKTFETRITSSTRADIDIYAEANIAALRMWDKSAKFYSLQDVSDKNVTITPYFRSRLEEVAGVIKEVGLEGDSVIVLSNSITGRIVQVYGRIFARKAEPIHQHWVIGYDSGVEKLKELVGT